MQLAPSGRALALVLALALGACKPTAAPSPAAPGDAAAAANTSAEPAAQPSSCPDADFASFLKRFESSADVQRAATANLVTMDSVDGDAQPEPKPVTKQVPRADVKFPILLAPAQRQAEGVEETITEIGPVEREVKHAIPDSGTQVRFNFQATPCWTLVRISDDTI